MIAKKLSVAAVGACVGVSALYAATVTTSSSLKVATPSVSMLISKVLMPMLKVSKPTTTTTTTTTTTVDPNMGMNLAGVDYFSRIDAFLNLFKTADVWGSNGSLPVPVDADGWPTAIPADATELRTAFYIGTDLAHDQNRQLRITWDGDAVVRILAKPGQTVQNGETFLPASGMTYSLVMVSNLNPARPFRNLRIVRADQAKALDGGEVFNPDFLARARTWGILRFMDWNRTNGSPLVRWADRTKPTNATWAAAPGGVPIEIEVALANKIHADAWINVPAMADDDYVRQLVTYVRDNLDPTLKLHLEYSNEVWNWGFSQTNWALAQAKKMWPTVPDIGNLDWYGYRTAQISSIARSVYGADADKRLAMVISTQTGWMGIESYIWRGVDRAGLGTNAHFDEWAVTTYWGWSLGTTDAADHAKVMGWVNSGAAGVDAAFQEIEHGGLLKDNTSLDAMKPVYAYQAKVAANHGLKMVSYEGSFGPTAYQFPNQDQDPLTAFYAKLENDPRMGTLYGRMADDFYAAGGKKLTVFNDIGPASKWGTWGTVDNLYAASVRWDALAARSKK